MAVTGAGVIAAGVSSGLTSDFGDCAAVRPLAFWPGGSSVVVDVSVVVVGAAVSLASMVGFFGSTMSSGTAAA